MQGLQNLFLEIAFHRLTPKLWPTAGHSGAGCQCMFIVNFKDLKVAALAFTYILPRQRAASRRRRRGERDRKSLDKNGRRKKGKTMKEAKKVKEA